MDFKEQASKLSEDEVAKILAANALLESDFSLLKDTSESKITSLESELSKRNSELSKRNLELSETKQLLDWFKRQLFGEKSEKRFISSDPRQLSLGEIDVSVPEKTETVKEHQRKKSNKKKNLIDSVTDKGLRFDSSVPVKRIELKNPELEGLSEDDYEVIAEEKTYRLAQEPSSYVVLEYVKKKIKLKSNDKILTPASAPSVIEKSYFDVSFISGMLIDKFRYHIPLYRQHQRLLWSGIQVSRGSLSNLVHNSVELLRPIYYALLSSILESEVLSMDETPIKIPSNKKGKMKKGYFWPVYGDKDEIAFPFSPSRATTVVREVLGEYCGALLTDGYSVYERFEKEVPNIVHAQCWVHARRKFDEAKEAEPRLAAIALNYIGSLYLNEKKIRELNLSDEKIYLYRLKHSKHIVDEFFDWLEKTFLDQVLLPSSPFTKAANYSLQRKNALNVFLRFPKVSMDTNHLEREIRSIALGRKNWLFCQSEAGAEYVGIIQSLIATCKLHDVNPYHYLVDVFQRIDSHPVREVHLLTPRLWKENFSQDRLTSDLKKNSG